MRKLLALFFVLSLLMLPAFAENNLDLQLQVRFANLDRIAKTLEISMDYMTSYIASINGDASKLNDFKSQFLSKVSDLKSARSHPELDSKIQAAAIAVSQFWEEYKSQFNANNGKPLVSLKGLTDALKAAKPELDSLTDKYWAIRKDNVLKIFDNDIAGAQSIVNALKSHKCINQMTLKLEDIKNSRSELESALTSRNDLQIINVQTKIVLMAQEFGNFVAGKC